MKILSNHILWALLLILSAFQPVHSEDIQWASKLIFQYNQYGESDFSGQKATGSPDALPYGTLNKNAFRLKDKSGYGTLTMGFDNPQAISQITIVESNVPGRIVKVVLHDTEGNEYEVYEGESKKINKTHNLFTLDLPKTTYKVAKIGVHMDTYVHEGWAQIDAIGISEMPVEEDLATRLGLNILSEDGTKISKTNHENTEEPTFFAKKERLDKNVNTPFLESKPLISPDGNTLFFARKNCPYNTKGKKDEQDIYFSTLKDGKWTESKNMGKPLNDKYPNGVCSVTPDGNTLLVINAYGDGFVYDGVSISRKKYGGWSRPKVQEIEGYHNLCGYQDYFLANSGRVMLMALQMEETYGDQDLYVSFLVEKNYWSKPINLGPGINTDKVEFAPFLASDNKTLYFSSNGHGGYGESDIFYVKRLDDTWQKWSEPLNIGGEINTPSWDGYYAVSAKGDYAYFVSTAGTLKKANLNPTDEDIYRIALKEEAKPDPVILITGRVFNSKTKEPIAANILYESLPVSDEGGIAITDPDQGIYKITLPIGKKYGFRAESEGYLSVSRNEDFLNITEYTEIERDLYLTPLEKGQVIQLNNLFFVQSKAEMLPESMPELDRLYTLMMEQPDLEIELGGHTDNQGIYSANVRLSQLRADAVKEFLVEKGIPKKRIEAKGYGPSKPVASNLNIESRKQNRRVEITILRY